MPRQCGGWRGPACLLFTVPVAPVKLNYESQIRDEYIDIKKPVCNGQLVVIWIEVKEGQQFASEDNLVS